MLIKTQQRSYTPTINDLDCPALTSLGVGYTSQKLAMTPTLLPSTEKSKIFSSSRDSCRSDPEN